MTLGNNLRVAKASQSGRVEEKGEKKIMTAILLYTGQPKSRCCYTFPSHKETTKKKAASASLSTTFLGGRGGHKSLLGFAPRNGQLLHPTPCSTTALGMKSRKDPWVRLCPSCHCSKRKTRKRIKEKKLRLQSNSSLISSPFSEET